jgi:radical SAM superfamily enzyme YgiQ (UPF0313 family)
MNMQLKIIESVNTKFYKLIGFNGRFIHSCLALFYVRGALEHNLSGCRPEIVQYTINDPYYPTLRRIAAGDPDALFFSVYVWNSVYIERLIRDLVKLLPDTPVILGGPQAGTLFSTLQPEISRHCTTVQGEIEGVDPAFYSDLSDNRLQRTYGGRQSQFASPYRPEDFAGPLRNRQIYYESSRGCPFSCTYCLSASVKGVRHLTESQVYDEMKAILRFNPRVIRFVDRTFNDLPERALNIWRFLLEQPGETLFHFEMAPDRFTEEMFRFLEQVRPGRFQFELGIQSTNPQTLEAVSRKCSLAELSPNIRRLVSLDSIHIHLDLILGLPHEDRDGFSRSFRDVFRLAPHHIQMGLLKVLPDTPMSKAVEAYGLVVCDTPPYELLANRWLAKEELDELFWFGECVESFYNNRFFRSFWDYLRRSNEDSFTFFAGLLELCREKNFFDLAPTQEVMSSLLLDFTRGRPDSELLRQLLTFDWLRCSHHFLPVHLEGEPLAGQKKLLWKRMGQNWEGVYDYKGRDEFFKQGVFAKFSGELLRQTGLAAGDEPGHVCFRPVREEGVFKHSRVLLIPGFCKADRGKE